MIYIITMSLYKKRIIKMRNSIVGKKHKIYLKETDVDTLNVT